MQPATWFNARKRLSSTRRRLGAASLTAVLLAGILPLSPVRAAPILGAQLYATGEPIDIEVMSATAALTSTLFLLEPEEVRIATNRDVGLTVRIGPYGAGEELIFGIRVSGQEYRMGPAERNPDGVVHAGVDFLENGCAIVGFEDLFGGGDRDYDDNRFLFCGGIAEEPPDPDPDPEEPPFVGPTADAGDDQAVDEGSIVTLDGTRSTASNLLNKTWTTTPDFGEGTSINLTDIPPDQLRLDDTTEAFNFIWIAASARGTVVKIDTTTGEVLGEYWSAPQNRAKDPSRTTVDHAGNVWVGNRAEASTVGGAARGSVTHIGLAENGQCIDRNGNGTIDTSTGLGDIKGWPNASGVDTNGGVETAVDECVLHYVRTNGVAIRQVSVDAENHVWVGGAALGGSPNFFDRLDPDGTIVRSINMRLPAQTGESGVVACCYGGLVDPNGILWSSADNNNYLVRIDPSRPNGHADLMRVIPLGRTSYGLGIDGDGNLWQSNWVFNSVQKISPAGAILNTFPTGGASNDRGVAATADGDIWVANSGGNTVSRLSPAGAVKAVITVGQQPTGVAVDAAGMVWASNLSSSTASRIDPQTNAVNLTVSLGAGAEPYNYSDMTGSTLTGAPDEGTWSVVHDSGTADTSWAFIDWTATVTGDGSLAVSVASSDDGITFGPDVVVTDGAPIAGLDDGRYLRVTVRFTRSTAGDSPVLFDLTAAYEGDRPTTLAYQWRVIGIDGPPVFLSSTTSPTPSFVAPDDATYTFELTVTDSAGLTDTDEVTVVVNNLDPQVEAEIGSAFARAVTLVNASLTDEGWLDTHAATFDWGDGSPPQPVAVTAQGTGWGTFFGSHVYADAGTYEVSVTLTDDDGGTDTISLGQVSVAEPVAVWANSTTAKKGLDWSGGGGSIEGRVHSNKELRVVGTEPKTIDGPAEYVSTITVTGPHTVTPVQSTVQPFPVSYNVADYAPGGPVARQVGSQYFDHASQCVRGMWDVGSAVLPAGVHYAPCSVKINGSSIGSRITLAATGSIELSGSRPAFEPFYDGVLLIAGSSATKAINISASNSKFLGVLFAGTGEISLSGSSNRYFCAIYGDRVNMSGFNLTLRGANCGRPDSTVSGPLLVPDLRLGLAADPTETLPGGQIDYDLEVRNDGSKLIVPGLMGLENIDTSSATVTDVTFALEYFSIPSGTWVPIASLANGRLGLTASANTAPNVTYPAPDAVIGTSISPGGFATWGFQAIVDLTPAEVQLLLNPTLVGGFRNRVDFTLTPATVQVRRLFTFGTDFVTALRALSGDITDPQLTFLPPAGDLITENASTIPALATLTPGEVVTLAETYAVPVPAPRSPTETDAGYLTRLLALDGTPLIGSTFALGQGGVGLLVAPLATANTTERLPVVSISTVGPDGVPAGTSAQYELRLANLGSSGADDLAVAAAASDDPLTVAGAPGTLAAGELATATTSYAAPADDPPADVEIAGQVTWSDAAGNTYGPVGSARTVAILTPATMTATLVDALQVDAGSDGQVSPGDTLRYTFAVTNHGDLPLTNVLASVAPDVNSALVVGSVAGDGTIVEGNGAGDTAVEVAFATIAGHTTVTFTFDVLVDDPFPTGTSHLFVQGEVTADGLEPIVTDDPALPGQSGTTRTAIVVPVPNLTAFLDGRLQLDPDGNGFPSAGDTLRYTLVVNSVGSLDVSGISLTVPTPAGTSLVPGSVSTTVGSVLGGSSVAVDIGSLASFTSATIRFDLLIANPVPAGMTSVSVQGTVSSNELADLATDNPNTFTVGDATVINIGSGGGGGGGTPGVPGPTIGGVTPSEGTVVTTPLDVQATLAPPAGETVESWTVTVHLAGDPSTSQILATGSGNTVGAVLDPTTLANGGYVLRISATGSAGGVSVFDTGVVVDGEFKLGQFSMLFEDLQVPVHGLPIRVLREYDTLDRLSSGDFGYGWSLHVADFQVSTNGPLGQGGWTMFGCGGGLIFVPLCFSTTRPHYVAVTWPDGRVETFDLTPARGSSFLSGLTSAVFTGRPGTTSTLEAADPSLYFSNGNLLGGFFGSDGIYDPTLFRLTDPQGNQYLLHVGDGLREIRTSDGNVVTFGPNGITSSTGPDVSFIRDPAGRIKQVLGPEGQEITYEYDAQGDLIEVVDGSGRDATFGYQAGHYLTSSSGAGTPQQVLEYEDGRLRRIIDPNGNATEVDFDVDAKTETLTSPDGRLTRILSYDDRGDLVRQDDVFDGHTATWTYEYHETGQLKAVVDPELNRAEADFNADGMLTRVTDATGVVTEFGYNDLNRPTSIKVGGQVIVVATYDPQGRLQTTGPPGIPPTTVTYDGAGRVGTISDPSGGSLTYTYDPNSYVAGILTPTGPVAFVNDDAGRVIEVTDQLDQVTTFEYDDDGRLLAVEDPSGGRESWTYNDYGSVATYTDKLLKTTFFEYDLAAQLVERTDRNGTVTTYTYSDNGLIETETTPDDVTTYTYDPLDRLIRASNADSTVEFTWDDANTLLSQRSLGPTSGQPDVTITNEVDPNGRPTRVASLGAETEYDYDASGRIDEVLDSTSGAFDFVYGTAGRLEGLLRPNGVDDTYAWEDSGFLSSRVSRDAGGDVVGEVAYEYGPSGLRTQATDGDGIHQFELDDVGRLVGADHPAGSGIADETYTYDAAGNRTLPSGAVVYDAADRLVRDSRFDYQFDFEGRLIRRTERSTGAQITYDWDAKSQLRSITHPGGQQTTFRYDGLGRRVEINDRGAVTRFVYDGANLRHTFDGSNSLTATYVTGPSLDGVLVVDRPAGPFYPVRDALGTTTHQTDGAGDVTSQHRYNSYGVDPDGAPAGVEPFAFGGMTADPTGLYYARARYYDPETGRFLSEDPIPSANAYAYGNDNPQTFVDPLGMAAMVEYGSNTSDDMPQACAASRAIVPMWDYLQLMVDIVSIFTPANGAVFWSGEGNRVKAEAFARQSGKFTIAMTPGGSWLQSQQSMIDELFGRNGSRSLWARISARFAQNATGEVFAFVDNASPDGIWNTVEKPELDRRGIKINYNPKSPCG